MARNTCPSISNDTEIGAGTGLTLADFAWSLSQETSCADPSYIRPDEAGAFLPWPYTLAWFLIHFPVTLIRVHRWERVQALSIILAIITIWFQVQAYTSSIDPDAVLVWMPIFVVLDIGAMMQLAFLIIEESGLRPLAEALPLVFRWGGRRPSVATSNVSGETENGNQVAKTEARNRLWDSDDTRQGRPGLVGRAWVALLAVTLGLLLLVIQIFGLARAATGSRQDGITAQWCSTIFAGAIAVESNCHLHPVTSSFSQGIGCITLRGYEQYTWLKASIIILSMSLVFQVFDCLILTLVNGTTRWRGAKMKRPWFTMFTGNIVLLVLIIVGAFQSQRLPRDIDQRVMVYKHLQSSVACIGELTPYGVRGAIIGWTDGFLESWGNTYSPKSA